MKIKSNGSPLTRSWRTRLRSNQPCLVFWRDPLLPSWNPIDKTVAFGRIMYHLRLCQNDHFLARRSPLGARWVQVVLWDPFFVSPNGSNTTVDQHGYAAVLDKFWQQLRDHQRQHNIRIPERHILVPAIWGFGSHFQTGSAVAGWPLRNSYPEQKDSHPWPAHSPDFTPMDFYLLGYLKSEVRKTRATSLAELKRAIAETFRAISTDTRDETWDGPEWSAKWKLGSSFA